MNGTVKWFNAEKGYGFISNDDGSGDVFNVLGCLRRLDDQWDYENDYPYLVQEGVDFYMGMSFEERIALFGYDTSLIPALT